MTLTTDRNDPDLHQTSPNGQNKAYLILSEEERAKGFVRPVRTIYTHVGEQPRYPTRPLTREEQERFKDFYYVAFEPYPEEESPKTGRYWTLPQLQNHGCKQTTSMNIALAETYARAPSFYGSTYCATCGAHYPVGEFIWVDDGTRVGS